MLIHGIFYRTGKVSDDHLWNIYMTGKVSDDHSWNILHGW